MGYHRTLLHQFLDFRVLVLWSLGLEVGLALAVDLHAVLLNIQTLHRDVVVPVVGYQYNARLLDVVVHEFKCKFFANIVLTLILSIIF